MVNEILTWMESSWLHDFITGYAWAFPTLETLHFMGLCVLFGSLMVIDLRLLGVARFIPMGPAMSYIPIAIGAFCVNLSSGIGFLFADPFRYYPNVVFRLKILCIVIAGLNALWFQFIETPKVKSLPPGSPTPFSTKFVAALSLVLWITIIVCGRLMPYFEY